MRQEETRRRETGDGRRETARTNMNDIIIAGVGKRSGSTRAARNIDHSHTRVGWVNKLVPFTR